MSVFSPAGLSETQGAWPRSSSSNYSGQKRSVLDEDDNNVLLANRQPEFDRNKLQNVTALVGKTAFLACSVRNLKPTQKVSLNPSSPAALGPSNCNSQG